MKMLVPTASLLYSRRKKHSSRLSLRPIRGEKMKVEVYSSSNRLDASFGNRCLSTCTSFSFVPLNGVILAHRYHVPAGGGNRDALSRLD